MGFTHMKIKVLGGNIQKIKKVQSHLVNGAMKMKGALLTAFVCLWLAWIGLTGSFDYHLITISRTKREE